MKVLTCQCEKLIEHYGRYMTCERCTRIDNDGIYHDPFWHVVMSQGRTVLAVFGSELLKEAEAEAKKVEAQTKFPAWLEMVVGDRPQVGQILEPTKKFGPPTS